MKGSKFKIGDLVYFIRDDIIIPLLITSVTEEIDNMNDKNINKINYVYWGVSRHILEGPRTECLDYEDYIYSSFEEAYNELKERYNRNLNLQKDRIIQQFNTNLKENPNKIIKDKIKEHLKQIEDKIEWIDV